MSLPPSLLYSARSTYRAVLRSARITFAGDLPRRAALESAVRQTFESSTLTPPPSSSSSSSSSASPPSPIDTSGSGVDTDLITQRLAEWNEIASFLRRNVVQGTMDESGSYSEYGICQSCWKLCWGVRSWKAVIANTRNCYSKKRHRNQYHFPHPSLFLRHGFLTAHGPSSYIRTTPHKRYRIER